MVERVEKVGRKLGGAAEERADVRHALDFKRPEDLRTVRPRLELVTSTTRNPSSGTNSVAIRARPYETDADPRRMQSLQQELWALDYEVHREYRSGVVHREVLQWFDSEAEGGGPLTTFAMEGDEDWHAVLSESGYTRPDPYAWYAYHVQELDLPSSVMRTWPYRADLDCVLEAPDETFAAYVLCWYDEDNGVGEFEPVGTHPDHRRRGFGAAVCRYALRRLQEAGARQAIVYAESQAARALHERVGFPRHTRVVEMREMRKER
jgi:ribosomal protein S18 acetylase RimI-like enzyme